MINMGATQLNNWSANNLENFIVGGCSFSSGTSDKSLAVTEPLVWPSFLLSDLDPKFYYNLAIPGAGNFSVADNLVYLLESKRYIQPENSIILFNISGLDRIDTMCAVDHPDANTNFSWATDFGFGWITEGGFLGSSLPFNGSLQKNIGFEQIQNLSCLSVVKLCCYLESRKFSYHFMLMDDDILDSPSWFFDFLSARKDRWIQFEGETSMFGFVKKKNFLAQDQFHPSANGHKLIATQVFNTIKEAL